MGNQGTIMSGQKSGGGGGLSSLFQMMNMYKSATSGSTPQTQSNPEIPDASNIQIKAPEFGESAMGRRAENINQQPDVLIGQALNHLDDPYNGMDYDTRMAAVEPLLMAKHGAGSQGQIKPGKQEDGGGLSKIISLAALV